MEGVFERSRQRWFSNNKTLIDLGEKITGCEMDAPG
jgi:hypothetical protein